MLSAIYSIDYEWVDQDKNTLLHIVAGNKKAFNNNYALYNF